MSLPSWLSGGVTKAIGGIANTAADIVDRFVESPDEKRELKVQIMNAQTAQMAELEDTLRTELQARERIITAEMNQGDNYTKRARPTLVYSGLIFIFLIHVLLPIVAFVSGVHNGDMPDIALPQEFWVAWGATVSIWSLGRSAEKRGLGGKIVEKITGSKKSSIFGD